MPTGPYEGRKFRADRQPFAALWLAEVESGRWNIINTTGPQQCGKSLLGFVLPLLYHLFEIGETVVVAVPSLDGVADKWQEDLLPVIERTRYRDLLPSAGGGSRGGRSSAIRFCNGATLRWMTAGGTDKTRASFTARVLVVTETDGFDVSAETSREGTKLAQLRGRTGAYARGGRRMWYQECTVSTEEGNTWATLKTGSDSRIMIQCPHCRAYVSMEREQLLGWQGVEDEITARQDAAWHCPACGAEITEDERVAANHAAVLVHRGQEIDPDGVIHGSLPPTRTLGFRWSAFHNLFIDAAECAAQEWQAKQTADEENAEKALRQFLWCLPYQPNLIGDAPLDPKAVMRRQEKLPHRVLPADTVTVAIGVDIGKWQSWYIVLAGRACGQIHVPDYGVIEVHSDQVKEEVAVLMALREFRDQVLQGLPLAGANQIRVADQVWIDAGYLPAQIHQFCQESNGPVETLAACRWWPCVGRGGSEVQKMRYLAPKRRTNEIREIGDGWFTARATQQGYRSHLITVNSDQWILWLQAGLRVPVFSSEGRPTPGAITLFDAGSDKMMKDRHNKLARHFASNQLKREMVADKGLVEAWIKHGADHWLDAGKLACAALNRCGFRLTRASVVEGMATMEAETWFKQAGK